MTYKRPQQIRTRARVAAKTAQTNPGRLLDDAFDDALHHDQPLRPRVEQPTEDTVSSTDNILSRIVAIPAPEHAKYVQVAMHLLDEGAYIVLRDEHDATERSADGNDYWHRWARFTVDGIEYVIHDPRHYDTDPLGDDKRTVELSEKGSPAA